MRTWQVPCLGVGTHYFGRNDWQTPLKTLPLQIQLRALKMRKIDIVFLIFMGESEESIVRADKARKRPGFESQGRSHQKSKTGVSVTSQKRLICSNFFLKKKEGNLECSPVCQYDIRKPNWGRGESECCNSIVILWVPCHQLIFPQLQQESQMALCRSDKIAYLISWRVLYSRVRAWVAQLSFTADLCVCSGFRYLFSLHMLMFPPTITI